MNHPRSGIRKFSKRKSIINRQIGIKYDIVCIYKMKKEILTTFIRRYTLGGLVPKVKWRYTAASKTLHTRAAIDNKSFVVDVVMSDFDDLGATDLTICIGDTEKVKGLMTPFGEDINITVAQSGDRLLGFTLSDADCESYCTAADPSAIDPVAKNLQDLPEYHVELPLSEDFIEKFLKGRAALKDVDSFSVGMNKKGLFELVIGYATSNSNRIRFTPPTDPIKNTIGQALAFPIKNIIEVLKANDDIPNGTLSINNSGIIRLQFKSDKFACTYYQFCNVKK